MHPVIQSKINDIFGDKLFVTPVVVGNALNFKAQTTYNSIFKGTFPVRLTEIGGRKMVSLADFVDFLSGVSNPKPVDVEVTEKKRGRGRPSKKSLALAGKGGAQ